MLIATLKLLPRKITSEMLLVVIGRAVEVAGVVIFLKMLTTLATKNDVGIYLLASSLVAFIFAVSFSALDQGLLRNIQEYNKSAELASRFTSMLLVYGLVALAFVFIAGIFIEKLAALQDLQPIGVFIAIWVLSDSIKTLNHTVASGTRFRALIAIAIAVEYSARTVLLLSLDRFASIHPQSILTLVALSSIGATAIYMVGHRSLLKGFSASHLRTTFVSTLRFSWPMIIWGGFAWLQGMSNRWLLNHFGDLHMVAEYGVLVSIATFPVTAMLGLIASYSIPIIYERENSLSGSSRRIAKQLALLLVPVYGVTVIVASLWHREIMLLLSSAEYTENSFILPILVAVVSFSSLCSTLTYAVYAQRRVASLLVANTLPGVISLIAGYFLVPVYHLEGAVFALILSHCSMGILFIICFLTTKHHGQGNAKQTSS